MITTIWSSQGEQWVHLQPQGGEKNVGVIYRENLEVHPQHTKCTPGRASHFRPFFAVWEDLELQLVVLDRL